MSSLNFYSWNYLCKISLVLVIQFHFGYQYDLQAVMRPVKNVATNMYLILIKTMLAIGQPSGWKVNIFPLLPRLHFSSYSPILPCALSYSHVSHFFPLPFTISFKGELTHHLHSETVPEFFLQQTQLCLSLTLITFCGLTTIVYKFTL